MPFFAPSEPQNVPADALLAFLDAVEAAGLELHSLMVLQRGSVLAKGWWEPYAPPLPHMLYSLSKSFTATAAGFAIAEKRFTLDDTVISFFPNELPDFCGDNLKAMRVRDLLSMATGHTEEPALWATPTGSTWASQFLAAPVAKTPGTHFLYNSPATYMVSALVEKTTGEGLLGYLTPRLFAPLGIENATWETSPQNIAAGGWGLSLPTEAIAKFGQLYLHGIWNGVRLLPEGWVETATAKHISNGDNPDNDWNQGYGFQFWRCRHNAYRGDGAFGQFCIVMPEQEAVVAITSNVGGAMGSVLNLIWEHLLPALQAGAEAGKNTAASYAKLNERMSRLAIAPPQAGTTNATPTAFLSARTYRFADNAMNLSSVRFDISGDDYTLVFAGEDQGVHRLEGSLSQWKRGETTFLQGRILRLSPDVPLQTRVRGAWINENTLVFKLCFVETPFTPTLTFHVAGNGQHLTLAIEGSIGFGPVERPLLEAQREM